MLSAMKDKKCYTANGSTVLLVSFFILLVISPIFVSARYLPTRSDNSRRERIREVLRLLLELSNGNENDLRMENDNYGPNVLPLSFSREASASSGPLVYEFGDGVKGQSASSSGLAKRSISPGLASDRS